jgi:hypothetical protein
MKKFPALFLIFFTCFFSCKKKMDDVLTGIQKNCIEINKSLDKLTKKQAEDIISSSHGNITGYYNDDEVKKIYSANYTDTTRTFSTFYFDDGMLIFAEEQNFIYNRPVKYTEEVAKAHNDTVWYDDKKTRLVINHYYFYKDRLIRWTADNIEVPASAQAFKAREPIIWAQSALLIKELKEENL